MKRYIKSSASDLTSDYEPYDAEKLQERLESTRVDWSMDREKVEDLYDERMDSDGIFRGCVAVVDRKRKMMKLAPEGQFLFYAFDYNTYSQQCKKNYPGMLIKTFFENIRDVDDENFEFMDSDVKDVLFDYIDTLDTRQVKSTADGVWVVLKTGVELWFRIDDRVDNVELYPTSSTTSFEFFVPSQPFDGSYDFSIVDSTIANARGGTNKLRSLKRMFKSRILDWAICAVNDSDPSWNYDTPESFSEACLDFIWDNIDEVSRKIGQEVSSEDLDNLSDWILRQCSKGDFGV